MFILTVNIYSSILDQTGHDGIGLLQMHQWQLLLPSA